MARIVRTPVSRLDIVEILLYLRARNRRAARLVHQAINNTITFWRSIRVPVNGVTNLQSDCEASR